MSTSRALFFFFILVTITLSPLTASAQMSESERKSAARAAYTEGVTLQDSGKAADALAKFETAQKLFDAPTHQLHIAECLSLTGKLLESSETYEALIHRNLGNNPPEAFTQAQEQAKAELPSVRSRIPNLRVTVKPEPSTLQNLQVTVNGTVMPNDLLGIARPVNPGPYRINAAANNYRLKTPVEITLGERDAKNDPRIVDLVLEPAQGAVPPPVVVPPPPPPYQGNQPPPVEDKDKNKDKDKEGSSSTGILVGPRLGLMIPGGGFAPSAPNGVGRQDGKDINFDEIAGVGGGIGIDIMARFAKLLLVGGTLEYVSLSSPSDLSKGTTQLLNGVTGSTSQNTFYLGINLGIVPNIDRVSFFGELGVGLRTFSRTIEITGNQAGGVTGKLNETFSGVDGKLGAGLMIPAGKIRIAPEASLYIGSFNKANSDCNSSQISAVYRPCFSDGAISNSATHTLFWIGLGAYFHADLGAKK